MFQHEQLKGMPTSKHIANMIFLKILIMLILLLVI